jgi:uncharacterized membrane protein HdeD (DUF308 family)
VALFGAYALIDGGVALIVAFCARGNPGFVSLLAEAVFGIGAGVVTFLYPGITAFALRLKPVAGALAVVWLIAMNTLLAGFVRIALTLRLRHVAQQIRIA